MPHSTPHRTIEADVHRAVATGGSGTSDRTLTRLFTDWNFAKRAMRYALHLPTPMHTEDRRVLEQVIFKHYAAQPQFKTILFVGCQWYTKHYGKYFFPRREYWTIEPDEHARKYGGDRHVVAPLEELDEHFPEDYFDLILCNGVYGFGLDAAEDCERAFAACYSRLRTGGELVLGWNDVPARTPVPLESIANLQRFEKSVFPPLGTSRYVTDTSYLHTYDFYVKPRRISG